MKKVKQILCTVLALVLMVSSCFYIGVNTNAANADGTVNTEVNVKTDKGWSGRSVLFMLSESDYAATLKNVSVGSKISEYNFLEKITITYNGSSFSLGDFAEAGSFTYVPARSANAGSIGFKVPQSYGAVPSGMTITIPSGTVFPSYAYVGTSNAAGTSGTKAGYITVEEVQYVFNNTESATEYIWEKRTTKTETEVNVKTDKGWSGRSVLFMLSESDYVASLKNMAVGSKMSEYNFLEKIKITVNGGEYSLKAFAEAGSWTYVPVRSSNAGSIAFKVPQSYGAVPSGMEILIPEGTVFPAYSYVGTTSIAGTSATQGGYITKEEFKYVFNNTNSLTEYIWEKSAPGTGAVEPTDITVTSLKSGVNANMNGITFALSESDYVNCSNYQMGAGYADYNFLSNIKVYINDTEYTLGDLDKENGSKFYNMFANLNTVTIEFADVDVYNSITKIVIPKETVFPALAYTGAVYFAGTDATHPEVGITQTQPGGFKAIEEIIFYKPINASGTFSWQTTEPIEPDTTEVTGVKTGHNAEIVTFTLSNTDYSRTDGSPLGTTSIGATHTDYNYLKSIQLYTSDTEYVTLENALRNQKYYNMWGNANTVSIELTKEVFSNLIKIVIPEGTTYPSYLHTNETQVDLGGFRTTKEIVFVKPEIYTSKDTTDPNNVKYIYDWVIYKTPVEYDTRISNVHVRYANGGKLLVFLETQDYPDTIRNFVIDKIAEYKILNSIVLYRGDESKTLAEVWQGGEKYYNLWGEKGCVAFSLADGWNGENITKVVVKEGCQFPSYEYTTGNTTDKIVYKAKFETTFVASKQAEQNVYFERTEFIPPTVVDTTVTSAKLMGAEGDVRFILSLSVQDYNGAGDSAIVSNKFKEYNTLSNIYLYSGVNMVTLEEIINEEEVYYNLWGYEDTISYGLKPEYSAKSFDRVVIQSGCEFPSFVYTSTSTDTRTAYTTSNLQELEISTDKFTISYYDETGNLLYEDKVICGDAFELREIPTKKGYIGEWSGLNYNVMPAQDISYYLSYELAENGANEENDNNVLQDDSSDSNAVENKTSPTTGDTQQGVFVALIGLVISGILIAYVMKKRTRNDIGE